MENGPWKPHMPFQYFARGSELQMPSQTNLPSSGACLTGPRVVILKSDFASTEMRRETARFHGASRDLSMQTTDGLIDAPNQEIPAAVPSLIDAAVAAFDADRDSSRRYLLRASALLRAKRGVCLRGESARRSETRGGLLAWQLNRALDYIEMHLADKITAMDLAGLINVSPGQLFRTFKLSVGVTPLHYVARRRFELACTMMRTTREPLSGVAVACGLCDQAHLCKVFRRMIGMSPSTWRRAISARHTAF
jgi:AraC family transcriptional regulator